MSFFEALFNALVSSGERITLTVQKTGEQLECVFQPQLADCTHKNVSEEITQVRAQLARPFRLLVNPESAEADLIDQLGKVTEARKDLNLSLTGYFDALNEGTKKAESARDAAKRKTTKKKASSKKAASAPKPKSGKPEPKAAASPAGERGQPEKNPDSLF